MSKPITKHLSQLLACFRLGFKEGTSDFGMTYDDDPESPKSRAYDHGRTFRRVYEGLEDWAGNEIEEVQS
jgi:hypothetical protein